MTVERTTKHGPGGRCPGYLKPEHIDEPSDPGRITCPWCALVRCESCGQPADVRAEDGSTWCLSCDLAAVEMEVNDA